jgi:PilZ domain.
MEDRRQNKDRRDDFQFKLPDDERSNTDRRQHDRRSQERIPVKMWVRNIEGDADYFQQTGNLSADGMYIFSPNPYSTGTVIDLEFQIPGTDYIIKCGAQILKCTAEDPMIGLSTKFVDMSDTDKKIITKAMKELSKELADKQ